MNDGHTKLYKVTGMSCAACSARVEKSVRSAQGVRNCSVNLLTGDLRVEGGAGIDAVIKAVTDAGYGCVPAVSDGRGENKSDGPVISSGKKESSLLRRRLIVSVILLLPLLYLSMGIGMFGLPALRGLKEYRVNGILQMVLSMAVLMINRRFFVNGWKGIIHKAPNMDTLVSLGSGISWLWSAAMVIRGQGNLYFESSSMILVLITVGKLLEARSKTKTTDAINGLIRLRPETAVKLEGENEVRVPVSELAAGDLISIRPGESVPADAVIIRGSSLVDESMITGESIPAEKKAAEKLDNGSEAEPCRENRVFAATINRNGYLICRVEKSGEDTVLSQIIRMVTDASATKAPVARIADRAAAVFVPVVLVISLCTFLIWLLLGAETSAALSRAVCVLVISCPCALGLATPVAIMVGTGVGAQNGILFKSSEVLENTSKTGIAVFDKTGTITTGHPVLTGIYPVSAVSEVELLEFACTLEQQSEHPIAFAVLTYGKEHGTKIRPVSEFREDGSCVSCICEGHQLLAGSRKTMLESGISEASLAEAGLIEKRLSENAETPVYFAVDNRFAGIIACEDSVRDNIKESIEELHRMGMRTVMLTGDNEVTARTVARKAGITEIVAGVLPAGKFRTVTELKKTGNVLMIGDGINDAPALKAADIGMAVASGTDVAMDAADVVLMKSAPEDIPAAIRLSRAVLKNIRQNLFWAFFYNALCIPLAAGVFAVPFGIELSPMIAAAAMSLSSIFVVTNALRLNRVKIHSAVQNKPREPEEEKMKVTIEIKGMMCPHCEARVRAALEAVNGVESVSVSYEKGTAVVTGNASADALQKAVTDAGYEVV